MTHVCCSYRSDPVQVPVDILDSLARDDSRCTSSNIVGSKLTCSESLSDDSLVECMESLAL